MCVEELSKYAMSLGLVIVTVTLLSWFASLFIKHWTVFQSEITQAFMTDRYRF